jgi:hypothetical protein
MPKSLWITLVVLSVAIGATTARADTTSAISFDTTIGQAPTSGVIDCDSAGCPNSIDVTVDWEGLTFNFSDAALTSGLQPASYFAGSACDATAPSALAYQSLNGCSGWDGWATGEESDGTWIMALDSGIPGMFVLVSGVGTPNADAVASGGTFTDPPVSTPEPDSGALALTGLALLGLMIARKGIAQGRQQGA